MSDDVELLGGILGAFRAGVVAVPVSMMLGSRVTPSEVESRLLEHPLVAEAAVVFVQELPKTATGKLQRLEVRELVADSVNPRVEHPLGTTG